MKRTIVFTAVLFVALAAQDEVDYMIRVEPAPINREILQYDDGTPRWVTNTGKYRGVWFDSEDFFGIPFSVDIESIEFWFYHSSSIPWETDQFYAEVWTGYFDCPDDLVDRRLVTAIHYSAVTVEYDPRLNAGTSFWAIVNTSFTSNGTHIMLADEFPN